MSKYIIDLPDNCSWVQWVMTSDKDGHAYFDFKSPEDLTTLDKELDDSYQKGLEEGKKQAKVQAHLDVCHDIDRVAHGNYQKGLDDAWECARRLVWKTSLNEAKSMGFIAEEKSAEILKDYTVTAAMKAVELYDKKLKAEIKVGDIITDGKINYLVIYITDNSYIALQGTDFEPVYIGKDYIKSYHNLHDSKDLQKIAEEISNAVKGGAE